MLRLSLLICRWWTWKNYDDDDNDCTAQFQNYKKTDHKNIIEGSLNVHVKLGIRLAMKLGPTLHPKFSYWFPDFPFSGFTTWIGFVFVKSSWIHCVPKRSLGDTMFLDPSLLSRDGGRERATFKSNGNNFLQWHFKHYGRETGIFAGERFFLSQLISSK